MKKYLASLLLSINFFTAEAQNVGIGTTVPAYKLDIAGIVRGTSDAYFGGSVGIGTTTPTNKLQVNNGSIALFNTTDNVTWAMNYSSSNNYFSISQNGSSRFIITNTGNVGINNLAPVYKFDVTGDIRATNDLIVAGDITMRNNKGVLYNAQGGAPLKYFTTTAAFTAVLPAFGTSVESAISFSGAGFTATPQVTVGDIVSTGGTSGPLFRVQLVLYDCTTTACKCRLINTSNAAVNYEIIWNIMCIGQ